jgi:hypothetical protein
MKCSKCGKKIKNVYTWNGEVFGIECWKLVALPELMKQKEIKNKEWDERKAIVVEVARHKDTSKIKNDFKVKILKDIPKFYDENGFISKKQYDILTDQFNNKDRVQMWEMIHQAELIDYEEYLSAMVRNTTGKAYQEAVEKQDAHYAMLAEQYEQQQITV